MKLVIDIPEWAEERHIYIMAGVELLAYKPYQGDLMIKTVRCNYCGWCCESPPKGAVPTGPDGACIYLETIGQEKMCSLGPARPWHCCWSDPIMTKHPDGAEHCCVKYEKV